MAWSRSVAKSRSSGYEYRGVMSIFDSSSRGTTWAGRDWLAFATISTLLLAAPATCADPVTRIGFRLSPEGRMEISVLVDGAPGVFTVDTAAEWSAIGPRLASLLDHPEDTVRSRQFVNDVSIGLGGIALRHQRLALLSSNDSTSPAVADGVIGADLIGRFVPEIDFDTRKLSFWTPSIFRSRGYSAVPLEREGWLAYINVSLRVADEPSAIRARFALGSGLATDVVLGYTFASDHRLLDREQRALRDTITVAQQSAEAIRLPGISLGLGRWVIDGAEGWALREPALRGLLGEADGLIGLGILRRFNLAIDYSRNTLYLRPSRAYSGLRKF